VTGKVVKLGVRMTAGDVLLCGGPPPPDAESLPPVCPKCGADTHAGYGLMGGGMGAYVTCVTVGCDFFAKQQDSEEE
jgi:hypothetical protein